MLFWGRSTLRRATTGIFGARPLAGAPPLPAPCKHPIQQHERERADEADCKRQDDHPSKSPPGVWEGVVCADVAREIHIEAPNDHRR